MDSTRLRVFVTGASGYLGQFFLDEVLKGNEAESDDSRKIHLAGTYSIRKDSECVNCIETTVFDTSRKRTK